MSVDEVINNAEALINGTEVNYTEASMNSLKDALSALKKIKAKIYNRQGSNACRYRK